MLSEKESWKGNFSQPMYRVSKASVVTKSSNSIMLLSFGGFAPKVNTAPPRCFEWHSEMSS